MKKSFRESREQQRRLNEAKRQPLSVHFSIETWLKDGNRLVTRKELYDFVTRLEVGKRMRGRWQSRLRRFGRWLWAQLTFNPFVDVEDPIYRPGFPTSPKRSDEKTPDVPEGDRAASDSPGGVGNDAP